MDSVLESIARRALDRRGDDFTRTPEELLDIIEAKGREVAEALAALRKNP